MSTTINVNGISRSQTCCCESCGSDPSGRILLTIDEAARFCKVNRNTIGDWMALGLVDWAYTQRGQKRVYLDSLIREDLPARSLPGDDFAGDGIRERQMIFTRCPLCGAPVRRKRVLITIKAAADKARASVSTVRRWMLRREIDWVRLPRGLPRIYLDSLYRKPPLPPSGHTAEAYCGSV